MWHAQVLFQILNAHVLEKQLKLLYTSQLRSILNVLKVSTHLILTAILKNWYCSLPPVQIVKPRHGESVAQAGTAGHDKAHFRTAMVIPPHQEN